MQIVRWFANQSYSLKKHLLPSTKKRVQNTPISRKLKKRRKRLKPLVCAYTLSDKTENNGKKQKHNSKWRRKRATS